MGIECRGISEIEYDMTTATNLFLSILDSIGIFFFSAYIFSVR